MTQEPRESSFNIPATNGDRSKGRKSSTKKVLSRKEKLEAAKKANQAMMKAWQLISQRNTSDTNAEGNV